MSIKLKDLLPITFLLLLISPNVTMAQTQSDWYMTGANPQRTSWVSSSVNNADLEWYRPFEPFIDPKVNIIATENKIFVSTSKGLYTYDLNGNELWKFNTDLPLGDSPTVVNGVVYIPGFDHSIRALNSTTGVQIWSFDGATAGFEVNPLVIDPGDGLKIYTGNRDGRIYALNANGSLAWQYPVANQPALGPISFPAVYSNNTVYFVSNNMHAYALNAKTGALIATSRKLPGEGFRSYWPVIYQDKLILRGAPNYRNSIQNITLAIQDLGVGQHDDYVNGLERNDFFSRTEPFNDTTITSNSPPWISGTTVRDGTRYQNYLAEKPHRRTYFVLNLNDLSEYTYDNGKYAPIIYWGTKSGNAYPPIVMPDNLIYQTNIQSGGVGGGIPTGEIMGWNLGTKFLSRVGGIKSADEPVAISGGGDKIYWTHICDRNGWSIYNTSNASKTLTWYWGEDQLPGVSTVWKEFPNDPWDDDLHSYFNVGSASNNSVNGIYGCHGTVNPLIPYNGKLITHRMNVLYVFGSGSGSVNKGKVPISTNSSPSYTPSRTPSKSELKSQLATYIKKMVTDNNRLRSGYHNDGQLIEFIHNTDLKDHFYIPGDTISALSMAYPHIDDTDLKAQIKTYLESEYDSFFNSNFFYHRGYANGNQREYSDIPPDILAFKSNYGYKSGFDRSQYYGLSKYAALFPDKSSAIYTRTRTQLNLSGSYNLNSVDGPWQINRAIMGIQGFLDLQYLANQTNDSPNGISRSQVQSKLNEWLTQRQTFYKDIQAIDPVLGNVPNTRQRLAISRNFMFLTKELGDYMGQNTLSSVNGALIEYATIAPYWFVSSFGSTHSEGTNQLLYDVPAIFQAKAWIQKLPYSEIVKYLDAPYFEYGDLYYITNVVAALEAPGDSTATPTPTVATIPGDANGDGKVDGIDYVVWLNNYNQNVSGTNNGDFNNDGKVDGIDYVVWLNNYNV